MNFIRLIFRMAIIFFLVAGCSDSGPSQDPAPADGASGRPADKHLRILFRWPGDDFATKQELEVRDKIAGLISERHIGKIIQSGTGMGWMDIVIEVEQKDSARKKIIGVIEEIAPDAQYTFQ